MTQAAADLLSEGALEVLEKHQPKWEAAAGVTEEITLLRLAVLRDITRELHAQRSHLLAQGKREAAHGLRALEARIDELRASASLDGELRKILEGTGTRKKRTRLMPEGVYNHLEREKFERYDRAWENAIASEAASLGWRFWSMLAWVQVPLVEQFHHALGERLHPHGLVLFTESAPLAPEEQQAGELWKGRWICVLKPRFLTPDFQVRKLPGVSLEPAAPQWRLLFSPIRR